jgi:hypothetical protein
MQGTSRQLGTGFGTLAVSWLLLGTFGCNDGKDEPEPTEEGTSLFGELDCDSSSDLCFPTLSVDTDDLRVCFAWDGPAQQWPSDTPQAILDGCPNPETMGQNCVLSFDPEFGIECENTCESCLPLEVDPATGDLVPAEGLTEVYNRCCLCNAAYNGLDDILAELEACGASSTRDWGCAPPDWIPLEEGECEGATAFRAPGSDYALQINPLVSFLSVSILGASETVEVSGGGSLTLTSPESLTATLWAGDGTFGGLDLDNWVFWGTLPLDYDAATGTFLVSAEEAPRLPGRGELDGMHSAIELDMSNTATGSIDISEKLWTCDYSESVAGQSVHLHLEGTLEVQP